MHHTRSIVASAFALALASISVGTPNIANPNSACHTPCILGRHPTLCTAYEMGRMDCTRLDHLDRSKWSGDMRNEEDSGQQESSQETYCG